MSAALVAEEAGLLADVIAHPREDGYRLVFADWCEDNGQGVRAHIIRADRSVNAKDFQWWFSTPTLRKTFGPRYYLGRPVVPLYTIGTFSESVGGERVDGIRLSADGTWQFGIRKGFPWLVRLPLDDWMAHGRGLVKEFPLLRVELSDREPLVWLDGGWCYVSEATTWAQHEGNRRAFLPANLAELLVGGPWQTQDLARDALSVACLRLADAPAVRRS